jgi:hypothetical protein
VHDSLVDNSPGDFLHDSTSPLRLFQDYHNRIVQALNATPEDPQEDEAESDDEERSTTDAVVRAGMTPALRAGMTPALRAQVNLTQTQTVEKLAPDEVFKIPVTTLRTPTEIVRQRVLVYDR